MPWNAHTTMSLRRELVLLADQPGTPLGSVRNLVYEAVPDGPSHTP